MRTKQHVPQPTLQSDVRTITTYSGESIPLDRDTDFRGMDLSEAAINQADLSGYDFTGANLGGATFNGVDFSRSIFTDSNCLLARFFNCKFNDADLSKADFTHTLINRSTLNKTNCRGGYFAFSEFTDSALSQVDFTETDLGEASFRGSKVQDCRFVESILVGANLRTPLYGCDFTKAQLNMCLWSHNNGNRVPKGWALKDDNTTNVLVVDFDSLSEFAKGIGLNDDDLVRTLFTDHPEATPDHLRELLSSYARVRV
jgi:uncharacterized protein YjbI with pentapeptide repeats